ncbi:Uncharacterised protein [Streptococcus pneumoniae]|nr:Uncharacterised protein [Streptococcus pneumoniae]
MRDANRGGCSQSCRWKYDLYDMPFGKERKSLQGEIPEEFSMSAVEQLFVNETSLTKGTKLSFMVQVSVILKPILKICMMPKEIKSTALQIQWNY